MQSAEFGDYFTGTQASYFHELLLKICCYYHDNLCPPQK